MDIFKRIAQGTTTDFGVFKSKSMIKEPVAEPTKEEGKKTAEMLPVPQQSKDSVNKEPLRAEDANTVGESPKKAEEKKQDKENDGMLDCKTIVCSQREPKSWASMILNDKVSANAIIKRATKYYTVVINVKER